MSLIRLTIPGNPVAASPEYRLEPLVAVRSLVRLDKQPYEEEEIADANEVCQFALQIIC